MTYRCPNPLVHLHNFSSVSLLIFFSYLAALLLHLVSLIVNHDWKASFHHLVSKLAGDFLFLFTLFHNCRNHLRLYLLLAWIASGASLLRLHYLWYGCALWTCRIGVSVANHTIMLFSVDEHSLTNGPWFILHMHQSLFPKQSSEASFQQAYFPSLQPLIGFSLMTPLCFPFCCSLLFPDIARWHVSLHHVALIFPAVPSLLLNSGI